MSAIAVRVRGVTRPLGWAIFLGMSWTWCIGMFLPVLLVRDYGPWAWVIFAAPNVVGAAAMGWTISESGSRAIVETHRPAVTIFSLITIAFQLFFAVWMFGNAWPFFIGLAAIAIVSAWGAASRLLSVIALIVSCTCAVAMLRQTPALNQTFIALPTARMTPGDLVGLTSCCLFGFALCPYLDGTFHRARRQLDAAESKIAFGFGFGLFFFAMIVGTLIYARPLLAAMSPTAAGNDFIWRVLRVHWMTQMGVTIGSHLLVDRDSVRGRFAVTAQLGIVAIIFAAGAFAIALLASPEQVYRGFIGFYGLVFPAYVWLCIIPKRGLQRPTLRNWIVFGAAVIVALPWLAMACLAHRMVDAIVGVGVVLAARLLVASPPLTPDAESICDAR